MLVDSTTEALTPVVPRQYTRFVGDASERVDAEVIGEIRFTLFVEERELVTLMCSPWQLRPLVVGFLYLEGLIEGMDDVEMLRVCLEDRLAEVRLRDGFPDVPPRKILTSGCTGDTGPIRQTAESRSVRARSRAPRRRGRQ